jgi:hypothetical protein
MRALTALLRRSLNGQGSTARLRVGGNVIAESMTELETQFLVSEMLERIPSLRVAASDDAEQP